MKRSVCKTVSAPRAPIASAEEGFHFYYIAGGIGKDATGCNVEDPASITETMSKESKESKETMDNSLFAASVHGAGRQRVVFTVEPP